MVGNFIYECVNCGSFTDSVGSGGCMHCRGTIFQTRLNYKINLVTHNTELGNIL